MTLDKLINVSEPSWESGKWWYLVYEIILNVKQETRYKVLLYGRNSVNVQLFPSIWNLIVNTSIIFLKYVLIFVVVVFQFNSVELISRV